MPPSVVTELKRLLDQNPEIKYQIGEWVQDFLLDQVERVVPFCPSFYGRLFFPLVSFLLERSRSLVKAKEEALMKQQEQGR